ncbi:hypothetical protein BLA27_16800 [Brucella cytisi]|jgi:hypothetical protein|uniref:Uncharacterized protein n=1 Tax=Brucella cytisi TaxID=407152 RepID=A0A1J6HJ08_9HYPH|nr:hypothetical protein BLA27_16800 [Brucella cytisi]
MVAARPSLFNIDLLRFWKFAPLFGVCFQFAFIIAHAVISAIRALTARYKLSVISSLQHGPAFSAVFLATNDSMSISQKLSTRLLTILLYLRVLYVDKDVQ